eukprot:TRINITY_DN15589_c0_g1_i2.p1 TRINITY_DN15589_c0_g1~~TRINITY_DN15589_c0_g1_i2.p1  ORF type:complete len:561 (-),score=87.87 TRINITY_DN15589_c0_g1_i2:71-1753(-)
MVLGATDVQSAAAPSTPRVTRRSRDVPFASPSFGAADRAERSLLLTPPPKRSDIDFSELSPGFAEIEPLLTTLLTTPKRTHCEYSDRCIPSRAATDLQTGYELLQAVNDDVENIISPTQRRAKYEKLLRNRLLAVPSPCRSPMPCSPPPTASTSSGGSSSSSRPSSSSSGSPADAADAASTARGTLGLFRYRSALEATPEELDVSGLSFAEEDMEEIASHNGHAARTIEQKPSSTLWCGGLVDDYYTDAVDWSSKNVLAVGLGKHVCVTDRTANSSGLLCKLHSDVTCVHFAPAENSASALAIGGADGMVRIWDTAKACQVRKVHGHHGRIMTMDWRGSILLTAGQDHKILAHDTRVRNSLIATLGKHRAEVVSVKWSPDGTKIASGGNDNKLNVWDATLLKSEKKPMMQVKHEAAVKALAWSPHQEHLLATGGGSNDRCIRIVDTGRQQVRSCVETGSQVCGLVWSETVNEIVSAQGYGDNHLAVWRAPCMSKLAILGSGMFQSRPLHLKVGPNGSTVAAAFPEGVLTLFDVFPKKNAKPKAVPGLEFQDKRRFMPPIR